MHQINVISKVYRKTAFASLLVIGSSFPAVAEAGLIYTPWTDAGSWPDTDGNYPPGPIWYCGEGVTECASNKAHPTMVHFRTIFELPSSDSWNEAITGEINISADYYALYINGGLKGEGWSNHGTYSILNDFSFGLNQIDIFACAGASVSTGNAGPSLSGGFNACSVSYREINNYMTVYGEFAVSDNNGEEYSFFFQGGYEYADGLKVWQARAVEPIPIPGTLSLIAMGVFALFTRTQRRLKRVRERWSASNGP